MRDVLATATNVIDIWPYIAAIPTNELFGHTIVDGCVEHVFRNGNDTFDHVLVVTKTKNVFLTVVVDLVRDTICGHRLKPLGHQRSRAGVPDPIGSGAAKAGGTRETKGEVGAVATGATVPEAGKTAGALPDLPITTISIAFPWVVMM